MEEVARQLSQDEYLEYIEKFKYDNKVDYEDGKIRKVFTECLPSGGANRGNRINWTISENKTVYFIYEDIEGWILISDYITTNKIKIIYNDNKKENITTNDLINCRLGRIVGKITSEFKIEISARFKDNKRDITIIDREIRLKERVNKSGRSVLKDKWYKYHCNIDGYEDWIVEANIFKGHGCSLCFNQVVVEGINDIPTTTPWMIPYFQGGYDEAKLYTKTSSQNIYPICPDCGRVKKQSIKIYGIYQTHSIGCSCSDKTPFGEKLVFSIFEQLGINFETQSTNTTFEWCQDYRYDFSFKINTEHYILETHGIQHYKENSNFKLSLKEQQLNDKLKKELALKNNIKEENYIVIDCSDSELNWIKKNIVNSRLNELFDLSKVDWNKAEIFALSNRVKEACNIKRDNNLLSAKDISKIMKIGEATVLRYIKLGSKFGWCKYDAKKEKKNGHKKRIINNKDNYIVCLETGQIFLSCSDCSRKSLEVFGTYLNFSSICAICRNEKTKIKGFSFKYIKDLNCDEYNYFNINCKLKDFTLAI